MNDYFVIFSMGLFKDTKTIFSYEKEGKFYLPIYTDSESANALQEAIKSTFGGDLRLEANVCLNKIHLLDMLKTIASLHREPLIISINPNLVSGEVKVPVNLINEEHDLADYIEHIEATLSMNNQNLG